MRSTIAAAAVLTVGLLAPAPAHAAAPAETARTGAATTRLVLPQPTGRDRIGTVSLHLIDGSRPDPWVPAQLSREIMVQLWYPAADVRGYPRADWVSPGLAAVINPPGSPVTLPVTHAHTGAPAARGRHPVVLYSPGFGVERTAGTALVEELASHGYVVVTIDHTHDAPLVEFPGGRLEPQTLPEPGDPDAEEQVIATALAARVADTRFTLDRLAAISRGRNPDAEHRPLPRGLKDAMDLSKVAMFGHSLGGATAAQVMYEDRRVRAGINMDGSVSGTVVAAGLDRPFLLLGSDQHDSADDESWTELWSHLRGPRRELQLDESGHMSFTDYQVLLPQAGVPAADLIPAYGTIDGARSVTVQRAYVLAFIDRYLRRSGGQLLDRPSPRFPEMRFVG
ncbi:dienelactone hydrolase [Allocatelliglobosispora scoriae]|uniref:Dienelactone hydrolase n=1 Tax=Allocatelliglobosispora scoriae TaxID=643052 RepID=A0A841BLV5_9ACTN|nr:hydrolase [Allocatelliglobosispora scoriae]MBB5867732.1 dienelactone hydrolase [Allocatelliglobosispora scoriae]